MINLRDEINRYSQLDDLICEEVNVKEIILNLGKSEKEEEINLVYNYQEKRYNYEVGDKKIPIKNKEFLIKLLEKLHEYKE